MLNNIQRCKVYVKVDVGRLRYIKGLSMCIKLLYFSVLTDEIIKGSSCVETLFVGPLTRLFNTLLLG
jgi:hypothetical protein